MRTIILALLTAVAFTGAAQSTQKLTAGKSNEYGLTYTLPATTLTLTLAAERTVKTPGEFRLYAEKYLHLTPILERSERWALTGAELTPGAAADGDERYLVQFKAGSGVEMLLTADGFPLSVNRNDYQPSAPAASKLTDIPAAPTILESEAARQAVTEEMLKSRSTAKRAELAAARIYEIRQTRADILSGQADNMPADGAAMQIVLDNLSRQEEALTAMFTGTESRSTEVAEFTITPPGVDAPHRFVAARLSVLKGIVDADDLSGAPVYVEFSNIEKAELPVNEKGVTKTFPKNGFAYRIPGQATVTVSYDGKTLARIEGLDVTQYGPVFGLDPALFSDKKAPSYLLLNPLTGGIVELGEVR